MGDKPDIASGATGILGVLIQNLFAGSLDTGSVRLGRSR
jgi:hypothetical protein